jgi:hypothetical protein
MYFVDVCKEVIVQEDKLEARGHASQAPEDIWHS